MPSNLELFLAQQKKQTSIDHLKSSIEEDAGGYTDFLEGRRWKPSFVKEAGSVEFIIRFLPSSELSEEAKHIQVHYNHTFKKNGQWIIETCPTTIKKPCPICEDNKKRYAAASERERKTSTDLKSRTRNTKYFANVLVVSDSINKENNGKVFVYEMPKTIFKYIEGAIKPQFASDEPFNPFNIFDGKNLHIRATYDTKKGQWGYDNTFWGSPSDVTKHTDLTVEEIFEQLYDISKIIEDKGVLSYEELDEKLRMLDGAPPKSDSTARSYNPNTTMGKNLKPNLIEEDEDDLPVLGDSEDDVDLMSEIDGMLKARKQSSEDVDFDDIPY